MTMPTAAQIEAAVARPTYQVRLHDGAGWVDVSADVVGVEGDAQASAGEGVGFGLAPAPTFSVTVAGRHGLAWDQRPIEVRLGFEGVNPLAFVGLVTGRAGGYDEVTWEAEGWQALIAAAPEVRSPLLYRRPVFTATTATSVEDPASPSWRGGLGNYVLWRTGGRPLAQAASYPGAVFYYVTDAAVLAPEWSWCAGGDAAAVLADLVAAAGGALYQDVDGALRYDEPLSLAGAAATIHYTDAAAAADAATRAGSGLAQYGDIRASGATRRSVAEVVRCAYVQRRLQGVQEIHLDPAARRLWGSQAIAVDLDLQLPCWRLSHVTAAAATLATATPVDLAPAATLLDAQRARVTLTNPLAETALCYEIRLYGQPLVAVEEGSAASGAASGAYARDEELRAGVYVQTEGHARRLTALYREFYGQARPSVELLGCGYDPRRRLGERVLLTCAPWGLSAAPHRVVGIRPRNGETMDLRLVSLAGLPTGDEHWRVGAAYADADVRAWGW